jgi:hypothetical protein
MQGASPGDLIRPRGKPGGAPISVGATTKSLGANYFPESAENLSPLAGIFDTLPQVEWILQTADSVCPQSEKTRRFPRCGLPAVRLCPSSVTLREKGLPVCPPPKRVPLCCAVLRIRRLDFARSCRFGTAKTNARVSAGRQKSIFHGRMHPQLKLLRSDSSTNPLTHEMPTDP